jgi:hypothetical protein
MDAAIGLGSVPMTLAEALRDPSLFGRFFRNKSWRAWKVFLAALFAEIPTGDDLETWRACTGRATWPAGPSTEAALIVGRRGGKSRVLALVAVYLATMKDYAPYLAPGEMATLSILAADRSQARVIFRFVIGLLKPVPLFEQLIARSDSETIELTSRVVIEITTASYRASRGYSFAAVLCDEVAFWRSDETSANPDVEILRAIRPGLASIPGSILLVASSPYAKRGELYNSFRRYYGKDNARVLVWKAPTQTMNPSLDPEVVREAYESDPEAARAEYGAEFRDDLADYISREAIDAVTMWGRSELPPMPGVTYSAFCDPSGGVSDAMTLAIGHLDRNAICILDAVLEVRPPFDPAAAVAQCAALLRRYGVVTVAGDKYAGQWPVQRFREHGIEFVQSARPKSDIYGDLLFLLNEHRVELLDLPRLSAQLTGLERRTARSGRDSIDHAPGGHDDLANAVAGCLVGLDLDRRPPMVNLKDVTGPEGEGVDRPWCEAAFMVAFDAGPDVGAVFCAANRYNPDVPSQDATLYVLDAYTTFFSPRLMEDLDRRFDEAVGDLKPVGVGIIASDTLGQQFAGFGVKARTLPSDFKPEALVGFAAGCVARGMVRFCRSAVASMKVRTIGAALALKAGDEVEGALRSALISAIWIQHGRAMGVDV